MKLKAVRHFVTCYARFCRYLFHFNKTNRPFVFFSNTIYEYALHSRFQVKTQKIDRSKFVNYKVKILRFQVKKLVALLTTEHFQSRGTIYSYFAISLKPAVDGCLTNAIALPPIMEESCSNPQKIWQDF